MAIIFLVIFVVGYYYLEKSCRPKPPEDMARLLTPDETTQIIMIAAAKGYSIVDKSSGNLILKKGSKVVNIKTAGDMYYATMPSMFWYRAGAILVLCIVSHMLTDGFQTHDASVAAKPTVANIKPISASDFVFDEKALPKKYEALVVKAVNKIRREDARCLKHIEPSSTSLSGPKSKPNKPVFYVTCGEGVEAVNVFFTPEDISNSKVFAAPKYYSDPTGMGAYSCDRYAKLNLNFPATAKFDAGTEVDRMSDGDTQITRKLTATNGYGVPQRMIVRCYLDGEGAVTNATMFETID